MDLERGFPLERQHADANGPYSIGSFYAFILSRSEIVRLTVCARSNYEAVKANGISITSENHGKHVVIPFKGIAISLIAGKLMS